MKLRVNSQRDPLQPGLRLSAFQERVKSGNSKQRVHRASEPAYRHIFDQLHFTELDDLRAPLTGEMDHQAGGEPFRELLASNVRVQRGKTFTEGVAPVPGDDSTISISEPVLHIG